LSRIWNRLSVSVCTAAALAVVGCAQSPSASAPPAEALGGPTAPATTNPSRTPFADEKTGLRLSLPSDWVKHQATGLIWQIAPPGTDPATGNLSLDIPELPAHIPGLIPIGMVKNGYVDDLRKAHPTLVLEEPPARPVKGAVSRLVRAYWDDISGRRFETALLMVHGDHVLILRAAGDAARRVDMEAALADAIATITWMK